MKRPLYSLCLLCLLSLTGCGRLAERRAARTPAVLSPGDATRTLTHAGRKRSYIVHVPPGYDPAGPTPVVLVFHSGGGNAENARMMTGFDAVADVEGFIVVYLNGTGRLADRLLTWNDGRCCGYALEQNVDDVGFVRALLADLGTVVNVDARRIYATGMSNGAIMSYRLACELADVIAAIGPVAATQNVDTCAPMRPVPVLHVHGDADGHAPCSGGIGEESLVGVQFNSVQDSVAFWAQHNGCAVTPQITQTGSVRHTVYSDCRQNAAVELYTVVGGGHAWPGGEPGWRGGDGPTDELNASQAIWDFSTAHPKP